MLAKVPAGVKVGVQGLATKSTMGAELVAGALVIKEAIYSSNMYPFSNESDYLDNTGTLRVICQRYFSAERRNNVALRFFFMAELVESGKIAFHDIETAN